LRRVKAKERCLGSAGLRSSIYGATTWGSEGGGCGSVKWYVSSRGFVFGSTNEISYFVRNVI
jgi:hypothetical protein